MADLRKRYNARDEARRHFDESCDAAMIDMRRRKMRIGYGRRFRRDDDISS